MRARRRVLPQDELARRPGLRTGEGAGELRPEEKRGRLGLADPGQRSRRSTLPPPPPAQAMREFLIRQSAAKDEVLNANFIYRSEVRPSITHPHQVTQREITNGVHKGTIQLKKGMTTVRPG